MKRILRLNEEETPDGGTLGGAVRNTWTSLRASLAGGAVGLEREWRQRPAGLRTHVMVSD